MRFCRMQKLNIFLFAILFVASIFCCFGAQSQNKKVLADDASYAVSLLDNELHEKEKFLTFDDAMQSGIVTSGDTLLLLNNEVEISGSYYINYDLTISSTANVNFIINGIEPYAFVLADNCKLSIDGAISFVQGENATTGIASTGEGSEFALKNVTIQGFNADILFENHGDMLLQNANIENNNSETLFRNSGEVNIVSSSIINNFCDAIFVNNADCRIENCKMSNNFERTTNDIKSQIVTSSDITIAGNDNELDVVVELDRQSGNTCKIVREVDSDGGSQENAICSVAIVMAYSNDIWELNQLVVETVDADSIQYSILNSPKINSNVDAYFLTKVSDGFVIDSVKFDVEYYIYSQNGNYDLVADSALNFEFNFGETINVQDLSKDGYQFVGWFGRDEKDNFYGINTDKYASIFETNLNESTSIKHLSFNDDVELYSVPSSRGGVLYYGKIRLYSKWKTNLTVNVECENNSHAFVENGLAGVTAIDDVKTRDDLTVISKTVFVGERVELTALANTDYSFAGWFVEENGEFYMLPYANYEIEFETGLIKNVLDNLQFGITNLHARFVYKTFTILLQKAYIDEYTSETPVQILPDDEYLIDAKIIKNGVEYYGVDYLEFSGTRLVLRDMEKAEIQISPDVNYHIHKNGMSVQKDFEKSSDIDASYEFVDNVYILSLENSGGSGSFVVTLYFEKNFVSATLVCGANGDSNNFVGGDASFAESVEKDGVKISPVFDIKENKKTVGEISTTVSKTANVYFGQDIIIYANTQAGYRFDISSSSVSYQNGMDISYEFVYDGTDAVGIKIFNILSDVNIEISYFKMATIVLVSPEVSFNGKLTSIAEIRVESDNYQQGTITRYFDYGQSINFETQQTILFEYYVFEKWNIELLDGGPLDLTLIGLKDEDLKKTNLVVSNIPFDLKLTAVYSKQVYEVKVIWNGFNGTIEAMENYDNANDTYFLNYGDTITLKISPKSSMYLLETLKYAVGPNAERKNYDGYVLLTLKNVTETQRVEVSFVPNTWWRHLNIRNFEGDGTSSAPYLIGTANELCLIGYYIHNGTKAPEGKVEYSKAKYLLTIDIDLGENYFYVPIGDENNMFEGVFDFEYHAVKNIKTESSKDVLQYDGLFNKIGESGKVIRQYKSTIPTTLGLSLIAVTILIAVFIVFRIEKKRQKPKKVFVLTTDDENNDGNK